MSREKHYGAIGSFAGWPLAKLAASPSWPSELARDLIAAQARIAELEGDQMADSDAECREFRAHDRIAGIDKHGLYQVAADGTRHDADVGCVLKVAASQVRLALARADALERERELRESDLFCEKAGLEPW